MKIVDVEQGSAAWLFERIGMITSTKIGDVQPGDPKRKYKYGEPAGRRDLKFELVCELLTNRSSEHYVSEWMKKGREKEPEARALYNHLYGVEVRTVGLVLHPAHPESRFASSPDGLVGNDGCVEFKCPKDVTHVKYLDANTIPPDYQPQCMWHIACGELEWCDFGSFCEWMPKHKKLFVKRMYRDDKVIRLWEDAAKVLQQQVDEMLGRIRERNRQEFGDLVTA